MPENVNTFTLDVDASADEGSDRPVMIEVDHVSMSFNMASEQLNNLKEYAIAIARHKLFFEEFRALDNVSFTVHKGDVFGIMGTNGSGKSTMLKIIAGVLEPTMGSCIVNGNIAPLIELGAGFDMDLTARENIYLNGALLGYSKAFIDENFDDIVEFAEVEKFLDMPMKNYSSGMVARVAFAIATVIVPDILLVDEVLSVGDFMFQKKCEDRIKALIEEHGVTVLIVSHNNDQIARLCNKAIWIEKGHVRLQGDAHKVARLYGSLAGRNGSADAEKRILNSLKAILDTTQLPDCKIIAGRTAAETNAKIVKQCSFDSAECVFLASSGTHINSVVSHPLAAALKAPLLIAPPDELPEATEHLLDTLKPNLIVLVDYGNNAQQLIKELNALPFKPAIHHIFDNSQGVFGFSLLIYQYGKKRNAWVGSPAIVAFEDNPASIALGVFMRLEQGPIFFSRYDAIDAERLQETLAEMKAEKLFVFGRHATQTMESGAEPLLSPIELDYVCANSDADLCLSICKRTLERIGFRNDAAAPLFVSALSNSQWPELLACAELAEQSRGALLLVDKTSLDGVAHCLDFIHGAQEHISELVFIGGDACLDAGDRVLLSGELALASDGGSHAKGIL